jgi:uncharacterized integral membrane protein
VPDRTEQGGQGFTAKQWAAAIALGLLLLFVLLNTQKVEVDFLVTTATVPLVFALLIAGLLGALVGWLLPRVRRGDKD